MLVITSLHWCAAPPAGRNHRCRAGAPGALKHRGNPDIRDPSGTEAARATQMHVCNFTYNHFWRLATRFKHYYNHKAKRKIKVYTVLFVCLFSRGTKLYVKR